MMENNSEQIIENAITEFCKDYNDKLSIRINSENTAQAYLFNYLIKNLDMDKYLVLTEFYSSQYVRHDIVILKKEIFDKYYNGSTSKFKELMKCEKVAVIEIKHTALFSKRNGFEKDINNLIHTDAKYKYFISLQCQKEYEIEYKEKFTSNNIKNYFVDGSFWN